MDTSVESDIVRRTVNHWVANGQALSTDCNENNRLEKSCEGIHCELGGIGPEWLVQKLMLITMQYRLGFWFVCPARGTKKILRAKRQAVF